MIEAAIRAGRKQRYATYRPVYSTLICILLFNNCTVQRAPGKIDQQNSTDCGAGSDCDVNDHDDSNDGSETSDATVGCANPDGRADADQLEGGGVDAGGSFPDPSPDSNNSAIGNGSLKDSGRPDTEFVDIDIDAKSERDADKEKVVNEGCNDTGRVESGAVDGSDAQIDASPSDSGVSECPGDMVAINDFCIDVYEASRSDATDTSAGSSSLVTNRYGVIPWDNGTVLVN